MVQSAIEAAFSKRYHEEQDELLNDVGDDDDKERRSLRIGVSSEAGGGLQESAEGAIVSAVGPVPVRPSRRANRISSRRQTGLFLGKVAIEGGPEREESSTLLCAREDASPGVVVG